MAKKAIVIGFHSVDELIDSGKPVSKIFLNKDGSRDRNNEIISKCKDRQIPFKLVPVEKLNRLSRGNHQGIIGFASPIEYQPFDHVLSQLFEEGKTPLVVYLDGVSDVRNIGAIARSCVAFGVHLLAVPTKRSGELNDIAIKASAGALLNLPVARLFNPIGALQKMKDYGLTCVGLTEQGDKSLQAVAQEIEENPTLLILGDEDEGISSELLNICDYQACISISKSIDSLNVSVAAGISLHQIQSARG